jgi:hypothetical protein
MRMGPRITSIALVAALAVAGLAACATPGGTTWDGLLLVDPQDGDDWGVVVGVGVGDTINDFIAPYRYNPHNGC